MDDVEELTVQPAQYVTDDNDVESTFFTFEATTGQPVQIKLEPVGDPNTQIFTSVLNGFEIDNLAPVDSYATDPVPADGDEHVFAHNDDAVPGSAGTGYTELSCTASELADFHDVYFGTDETEVTDANTATSDIYQGRQGGYETTWDANDLDSKNTYYRRIDTVKEDGSVTKGYVWSFRTRHLAYPDAEGYGRFARGGRNGWIVEVTTLEDYDRIQSRLSRGA